ncbi:unnamed protein product [Caenorhabditis bovis]|uniref:7TM GPCR serpentine receptor class x (Srx) domain-containing protein n=1 Tax=Caenorhabditis bovis TaxID=2654633 RepID=A0A8S1EBF0_9PELO|nr:unnamed protein product [Caenorhabditis bovis]
MSCWYAGNVNHIVMTLNRFAVIFFRNDTLFSRRNVVILLICNVLFSCTNGYIVQFVFPCCAFLLDHTVLSYSYYKINGVKNWTGLSDITLNVFSSVVPVVCYSMIICVLRKNSKRIAGQKYASDKKKGKSREIMYTIQFGIITFTFTIAWILFQTFPLFMLKWNVNWFICIAFLNTFNSSTNAVVFLICNSEVKNLLPKRIRANRTWSDETESRRTGNNSTK